MYNHRPTLNRSSGGVIKVRVVDDQAKMANAKVIALKELNFLQELPSLTRYLELAIRKSPSDPVCIVNKIVLKARDKPALELSQPMYDRDFQSAIYTYENVQLTLYVTSKPSLRSKINSNDENNRSTSNVIHQLRSPLLGGTFAANPGRFVNTIKAASTSTPQSKQSAQRLGTGQKKFITTEEPSSLFSPEHFGDKQKSPVLSTELATCARDYPRGPAHHEVDQSNDNLDINTSAMIYSGRVPSESEQLNDVIDSIELSNERCIDKCNNHGTSELSGEAEIELSDFSPVKVGSVPVSSNKERGRRANSSFNTMTHKKFFNMHRSAYSNCKTSGEMNQQWMHGLRRGSSKSIRGRKGTSERKTRGSKILESSVEEKSTDRLPLSPLSIKLGFNSMESADAGGRPSIETMTAQWEFMKSQFVSGGDDLDWLMISKKEGAREYAAKKNEKAEDLYFKSLHEISVYEDLIGILTAKGEHSIFNVINTMASTLNILTANPLDVSANAKITAGKENLRSLFRLGQQDQVYHSARHRTAPLFYLSIVPRPLSR